MALRRSARQTNRLFVPLLELPVKRHCHTEALKSPRCLHREATVTLRSLRRPVSGTVDSPITLSVGRQAEIQLLVIDCRLLLFQDQICSEQVADPQLPPADHRSPPTNQFRHQSPKASRAPPRRRRCLQIRRTTPQSVPAFLRTRLLRRLQ